MNSKCATDLQQKQYLNQLLGDKQLVTTLLYRGSEHGWKYKHFHSHCDNRGPTISLLKIKDGDCIGGYTNASWQSPESGLNIGNSDAFLFNLTRCRHFPSLKTGVEILCWVRYGPCFYGDVNKATSLNACEEPFNGVKKCNSFVN